MTREEIERYLRVGRRRAATVDIDLVFDHVRTVSIRPGPKVLIEFEAWGYDEGGAAFSKAYDSLDDAVRELEAFLKRSISSWMNVNATGAYPDAPEDHGDAFINALRLGKLPLPSSEFVPANTWTTAVWQADQA
jgi:hypothetical protein